MGRRPKELGLWALFARGQWVRYAGPVEWLHGRAGTVHSVDEDRGLILVNLPGVLKPFGAKPGNLRGYDDPIV